MINAFAYMGISTPNHADWNDFGTRILGLERGADSPDGGQRYRLDDALFRLAVYPGDKDDVAYLGWTVNSAVEAAEMEQRLTSHGVEVTYANAVERDDRGVEGYFWFTDPYGFRHEIAWGQFFYPSTFHPGRAHAGFRTGDQGLGHAVLILPNLKEAEEFYRGVMGFKLSDYIRGPFDVRFYHVNGRHHSFALAEGPCIGVHHLMFETNSIDDVGIAHDLVTEADLPITMGMGRHVNDLVTSFYVKSPSGFAIEYGSGGLEVDDLWVAKTFHSFSIWGHKPHPNLAEMGPGMVIDDLSNAPAETATS